MNALEILIEARELLNRPEKWTRTTLARDINGVPINPLSEHADRFCVVGAMRRVSETAGTNRGLKEAEKALVNSAGTWLNISAWNDAPERSHIEILSVFDKAIKRLTATRKEEETS